MKKGADGKFWLGIAVSVFFMALLFRKIDRVQLVAALRLVDYRFVMAAIAVTFLSYFLRAVRWRYLLIHEKTVPLGSLYPATVIGYMANNILPARLGEFVRAYVLAQREGMQTATVFASLVIDRLFDGFSVLLMLILTLFTLTLPPEMTDASAALRAGGMMTFLLYCGVMVFLFFLKNRTVQTLSLLGMILKPFPASLQEKVIPLLGSFIAGIRLSTKGRHLMASVLSSLLIWACCVASVDMVLRGFSVHLPITASMFILVLLVFAVMVPASPGFIGTYHYACFKGLATFGIAESTSLSIALIMHGVSFFPAIAAGFYHLWRGKISLSAVRKAGNAKL